MFLLFLCDIVSPISCPFRSFVSEIWIVSFRFFNYVFLNFVFLISDLFPCLLLYYYFRVFFCCGGKKHVKTQTEKEHTETKENESQAYGHPVYGALDMRLTERIGKGD